MAEEPTKVDGGFISNIKGKACIEVIVLPIISVISGLVEGRSGDVMSIKVAGIVLSGMLSTALPTATVQVPYKVALFPAQVGIEPTHRQVAQSAFYTSIEALRF